MALGFIVLNPGAGGAQLGTDQILGTDYVVHKLAWGSAGALTLIDAANPLPVNPVNLPPGAATAANQATEIADLDQIKASLISIDTDIDAALSSRASEATLAAIKAKTDNLDVLLSTRLKPADTLAALTNLVQLNGQAINMGTGVRAAGTLRVTQATDDLVHVDDNAGSLTVDAPVATPVFVRLSNGAVALIGQQLMAASLPVVLASDQSVLSVNADIKHDDVNTLQTFQVGGHAYPPDVPPTAVSANGDRARLWVDRYGSPIVRRRKIRESYTATFRLAETAARLDGAGFAQVAHTNKQWATIHHTAVATKEVRLEYVVVWITSWSVASQAILELREIGGPGLPSTGNPAITPKPRRNGGSAAESTCLYLPTTPGTELNANAPLKSWFVDEGIMGAAGTANPLPQQGFTLYSSALEDGEMLPPVLPIGTASGFALMLRCVGAPTVRLVCEMGFTEEIP